MMILVTMFLLGLFGAIWGFMACFMPAQWDRLTEVVSFADRWSVPSPKRRHPLMSAGQCAGGLVICVVGCWFAYLGGSGIYRVLAGRALIHAGTQLTRSLPCSP